jgi:hypothetical protein
MACVVVALPWRTWPTTPSNVSTQLSWAPHTAEPDTKLGQGDFRAILPRFTPEPMEGERYPPRWMATIGR